MPSCSNFAILMAKFLQKQATQASSDKKYSILNSFFEKSGKGERLILNYFVTLHANETRYGKT